MPFSLILPFLSISLLFLLLLKWRFGQTGGPGPKCYPIIGCLISFYKNRTRLLDWYTDMLSASETQTITVARFGARRTIVTANPLNVRYILKTNFINYPKGRAFTEILGDFLGNGIFNVDGDLWYKQRKLVVHQFTAKCLQQYSDNLLSKNVEQKLLSVLQSAHADAKILDLQDLLRRLAFDLVCQVSLGYNPCCLEYNSLGTPHPIMEAFDLASFLCAKRGASPLSILWKLRRFWGIGSEKKLKEAVATIHEFLNEIIRDRKGLDRDEIGTKSDLLSKLVLDGEKEEVIRDTIISFIMAGRDTTSSAMTWLFYLLSRHPDVESEVVRELSCIDDVSMHDSLEEQRFLKACICESMRLYPPVAWDSKHAIIDDYLPDGTRVWAGDRVTYFPYGMGRMKGLWGKDRFEFKPERWVLERGEDGRIKSLKNFGPYKFPVFHAGPRACLGKEMAFVQMKYIVALIVKRFEFKPVSLDRPVFVPLLTAHMAGGFQVLVSQRRQ